MVLSYILPSSETGSEKPEAKKGLRMSALFLGEVRDGLTMINMQSAFLIVSKQYTEKQAGILFFVFGMSQFLFQAPAGYLYDYTEQKVLWLSTAAVSTTLLTVITAMFAAPNGGNLAFMILIKFLQGAVTSFIPPGLNSITRGIVGGNGMTEQVSVNEMMNHLGTAIIVFIGSLVGYYMYPSLGLLFLVSPIACLGALLSLQSIPKQDIDHAAARGLESTAEQSTDNNYVSAEDSKASADGAADSDVIMAAQAESPWTVLRDPILLLFILAVFLFHMSNGTVLPLVMQTLALGGGGGGILMSGLCIIVAQLFMVASARTCGEYSGKYGRKKLFLIGLFSVPVRCLILTLLVRLRDTQGLEGSTLLKVVILSTQMLDGVGAGVFGTMYILVTSDLSQGSGRFSFILGLTTAAMSIGGTVSGYLGEALAQDLGYESAFFILMILSLAPALLYTFFMPETLSMKDPVTEGGEEEPSKTSYKELL
ncbi:hypothetical protein FisN_6Hh097 [Fistulifera solaris]|uniref:Major facilitator superfamily (MFS) profile domain-containing protein n=1 Tax=Fistulifera solaris TaxID=1519565 RepID=A0A1Z5KIA7_FISSO|nr:hypothetical protein FisN_6Hh097 [Fistulifera solaris]|eukprot:GAX25865.1 hypothetical protein FisN_6Hh097 [Fistulifera solaris]